MHANELRSAFTSFFAERDHEVVPSASLIPHDATLLFTNAGMVPFKTYFVGEETPPWPRATTVQKCVRAGGKHNDLDEVGRTSRHLTFFEMLGNFSFGDYFKAQAIPMAWAFFTEVLGLDPERLWVTVHHSDDEAADIWRDVVGVPSARIQRLGEDNWWRMADTGPNGPCSEIFWDKGADFGPEGGPADPDADERYVEIWNLVFMQFDNAADGTVSNLPRPSIDTGAGLERVLSVLQGVDSVWATDEFVRLVDAASSLAGLTPTTDAASEAQVLDDKATVSLRILADHARSTTMLVNDGVFPSNEERGYVLRRIIRRAVRHAYLLGITEPVMASLSGTVIDILGEAYPDLIANRSFIGDVLDREERSFRRTLASGSEIVDDELAALEPGQALGGDITFTLHDTYGFPLELTVEIATERGIDVDVAGFDVAMAAQRNRAKADQAAKGPKVADQGDLAAVAEVHGPTEFVGRATDEATGTVLFVDGESVVLDRTPFYAESGGQVGDTGVIETATGRARVIDTVAGVPGQHRHVIAEVDGTIEVGQEATARIDAERRAAIRRNHTATHLLHWALRDVLGGHVKQQGSWVGPERLRFDFSHYEPLTPEQTARIEDLVNADVLANTSVRHFETTMAEATQLGAIAFFGDKYGDVVRVLEAGPHSIELCGGTHVGATGDIGPVKIVSEGSIGSNLRRIEAVSGTATVTLLRGAEQRTAEIAALVGVPVDNVVDGIRKRLEEFDDRGNELRRLRAAAARGQSDQLAATAVDGVVVARVDGATRDDLRELAVALRDSGSVEAAVLGAALDGGGAALVAAVRPGSAFVASELIADAAKAIKGGGGKGADVAMAGGKDATSLDDALDMARAAAGIS